MAGSIASASLGGTVPTGRDDEIDRSGTSTAVDIGAVLDDGPFTTFQKVIVLLAALAVIFDGCDTQMIGFAIPVLIKEWHITRNAFAPIVAAGLVGMGIGSACAGLFADRFGRRRAVIGSVLVFGIATGAIGFAPNVTVIALLRFVAGLGIGGAVPTSATLTAEYTPLRFRTIAITITILCIPLGGMFAGLFSSVILGAHGWRVLFFTGGALPLILAVVLLFALPESPRFLSRHRHRWGELTKLLGRMARDVPDGATFVDIREQGAERHLGFTALFKDGRASDTVAIWCAFFMCLLAVYAAFSWLPTMLTNEGLSVQRAGYGLTLYNLGGALGALACAVIIARFGSRVPLILCCVGAAVSVWLLITVNVAQHITMTMIGLFAHGLFVNAVQVAMVALCAHVYPTGVRATGTASAFSFGRIGSIVSAFAGAAVITAGGAPSYLVMLGGVMVIVLIALSVVRRHIPRVN
ncbi:MFS transporter [Paraburkholderia sp. MM5384-R2]|uniref:MFS transporter n=1 Tax=Paraburkholderia sp. MM5384-R2 TaxID=2723097 RepID=UPI0016111C70|nr:MFS transporter [Paraburkholderia sp. MM5384-R2]MBB5497541.1 AAHS family 4-hydroxybenzoate transporter-like MFS transporter [Paraburkholderia sp. MM5384-R2]